MPIGLPLEAVHACVNCPLSSEKGGEPVCDKAGVIRFWDPAFACPENRWAKMFVAKPKAMRGLGDAVKRGIDAVSGAIGVQIKPCDPCAKRQDALNKLLPFRGEAPSAGMSEGPSRTQPGGTP